MKFIRIFAALLIFIVPNLTFAEQEKTPAPKVSDVTTVQEFSAKGEYRLGDDDTRSSTKIKALNDAKRKIIEQIGVYVTSYSEMNNSNLDKDFIRTVAAAMIKIKSEETKFSENGMLCEVFIVATADTDNKNIAEIIEKLIEEKKKNQEKPKNKVDPHLLEIAGIYEWNSHYYKLFDESMDWSNANKRCKDMGGHLVTITSKEEQAAIQAVILYSKKKKNYYWTAGFNVEKDNWRWNTGEDFTYTNWAKGEPNNDLGNEFILSIYNSGEWNDCPADGIDHIPDMDFFKLENAGFICEWENLNDIKMNN